MFKEIIKFVLTGVIAFVASAIYTSYRIEPSRNISIIPIISDAKTVCRLNRRSLISLLESVPPKPAKDLAAAGFKKSPERPPASLPTEYMLFLSSLHSYMLEQPGGADDVPVLADKLASFKKELISAGAVRCGENENNQAMFRLITIEALIRVETPGRYAIRRDCTATISGSAVPVWLVDRPDKIGAEFDGQSRMGSTFLLQNTAVVQFRYDSGLAGKVAPESIDDAFSSVVEDSSHISIKCKTVRDGGAIEIGGASYPFSRGRLSGT